MRSSFVLSFAVAALIATGCGESANQSATITSGTAAAESTPGFVAERPANQYDDPRQAVNDFLVAVKSGDDKVATSLLTTDAQKEAWSNGMAISGDGFPDAKFDISEVEYIKPKSEAHVMSTWSDRTPYGDQKSFQCVWLLREEAHGWCIYGMATKFLENVQPIVLNFENQAEMAKRQQWAEQQIKAQKELETHQQQAAAQGQDPQQVAQQQLASQQQQPGVQQAQQTQARQQASQDQLQSVEVPKQRQPVRQATLPTRSSQ